MDPADYLESVFITLGRIIRIRPLEGVMIEGLLDLIYEAALLADLWPDVLDKVSAMCGAKGGVLHVHTQHERRWTASPGIQADFEDYLAADWPNRSDRVSRGIELNRPGFVTDNELFNEREMAVQPVYQDFLIPRGLQATAATHIGNAADGDLILSIWGFSSHAAATANIPALDSLRPHLARASIIAGQQQLERARSVVDILARFRMPAAMLGSRRRVLVSNDLFHASLSDFGHETRRGLYFKDARADGAFGNVLDNLDGAWAGGASLPLRLATEKRAILHVLPVRGAAHDLITGARALLALTTPGRRHSPNVNMLRSLFDLTPAEAKLAEALSETTKLTEAAKKLKITVGTARTQLKPIFYKTAVRSQSELLVLLNQYNDPVDLS